MNNIPLPLPQPNNRALPLIRALHTPIINLCNITASLCATFEIIAILLCFTPYYKEEGSVIKPIAFSFMLIGFAMLVLAVILGILKLKTRSHSIPLQPIQMAALMRTSSTDSGISSLHE